MEKTKRAVDWEEVPLLISVPELRTQFGLSRGAAYALANTLGRRIGKRLLIPKAALKTWMEGFNDGKDFGSHFTLPTGT